MESKDAFDVALKIGGIYSKNLLFFIAICTLYGGWIVVNGIPDSVNRHFLLAAFLGPSLALWIGQVILVKRINAALVLARDLFESEEGRKISDGASPLFMSGFTWVTHLGAGIVVVAVSLLVLLSE